MPNTTIQRNIQESIQVQIENYILRKIESGEWPVGSKIMSERDLSELLQVSRTTVRRAIQTLTDNGVFVRKVGQGTFVNKQASVRTSTVKENGRIGYIINKKKELQLPISEESFYFDMFSFIEEECVKHHSNTQLFYLDDSQPDADAAMSRFISTVDGIIVDGEDIQNGAVYQVINDSAVPVVFLTGESDHDFDMVSTDSTPAFNNLVSYLYGLGHRHMGIICGNKEYENAVLRCTAWKRGLADYGIEPDDSCAVFCPSWTADSGYKACTVLIQNHPELTAIVCENDLLAIGAISALTESGRQVPDDISVTGFDNSEWSRHSIPPLTTITIFTQDIARTAVNRIYEHLTYGILPVMHTEFQAELVIRKSCSQSRSKEVDED